MTYEPTAAEVASMYDGSNKFWTDMLTGTLHFGYYWDEQHDDGLGMLEATDRLTSRVGALLNVKPGQKVLDIGCGTGKPAVQIASANDIHITGINITQSQLDIANAQLATSGPKAGSVSFQLGDAMKLQVDDVSFDGAYAIESLIHVSDKGAALAHIARALRPGSRLVVADYFLERQAEGLEVAALDGVAKAFELAPSLTIPEFKDVASKAGLNVVDMPFESGSLSKGLEFFAKQILAVKGTVDSSLLLHFKGAIDNMRAVAPIMNYAIIVMSLG